MGKKVCFVATTSVTMKCFIVPIAHELARKNIDVTLVCSEDESMNTLCGEKGIKYHPIHMGRGIDASGIRAAREIKRYLKAEKFDLVQYCTPNAACYTAIAAKRARVPIRLYCQWGIRYVGLSGISRKFFKLIEKMVCNYSTDIRAVSWKNRDFAVSEGLYQAEKAKVVGNGGTIGVDTALFDIRKRDSLSKEIRTKYGIPDDAFVFGFCGRLSRDKGSNELLSAFRRISGENTNVRLMIVGDVEGKTGIDENLCQWTRESGKVIFTGMVPGDEIYRYYAPMNVLVHPTYREGFGMVIQEAGAYGIPCITTKIPGASEVMVDGESCFLVDAKDVVSLEKAMRKILDDKEMAKKLGDAAYKRTKELYDRSVMMRHQIEDYWNLLAR